MSWGDLPEPLRPLHGGGQLVKDEVHAAHPLLTISPSPLTNVYLPSCGFSIFSSSFYFYYFIRILPYKAG
jgi:hypothetical protein